jgi:hypothetical protein
MALEVDRGDLLALAQIGDRRCRLAAATRNATPRQAPAAVEPEHEARPLRRAAMDVRKTQSERW